MAYIRFDASDSEDYKRAIVRDGQPVKTKILVLNSTLLAVVLEPLPGFVHLVRNPQECIDAYGPYHISICQLDIVSNIEVLELEARWNDREVVLPIAEVRSEGCMYLDSCPLADDPHHS